MVEKGNMWFSSIGGEVLPIACLQVSTMFKDKEFCIVNGLPTLPKDEMERKIAEVISTPPMPPVLCKHNTLQTNTVVKQLFVSVQHGGTLVQNPTLSTFTVVVHKINVKARNIIR